MSIRTCWKGIRLTKTLAHENGEDKPDHFFCSYLLIAKVPLWIVNAGPRTHLNPHICNIDTRRAKQYVDLHDQVEVHRLNVYFR